MSANATPTTALQLFGEARQVAYVVPRGTLQLHIAHWSQSLGVGPWRVVERPTISNFSHRGTPGTLEFSFALAHMGTMQIEIIEQHNDTPSTYNEFLEATNGQGGLHHIAYWPDDMNIAEQQVAQLGWSLITAGELSPTGRFRYYETPNTQVRGATAPTMELAEVNGKVRNYFLTTVAELSRTFNPHTDEVILQK